MVAGLGHLTKKCNRCNYHISAVTAFKSWFGHTKNELPGPSPAKFGLFSFGYHGLLYGW
jgi:hypothetical protein